MCKNDIKLINTISMNALHNIVCSLRDINNNIVELMMYSFKKFNDNDNILKRIYVMNYYKNNHVQCYKKTYSKYFAICFIFGYNFYLLFFKKKLNAAF
ncbi:hypothetical protein RFI_03391 [Reticulomyxa filosa]|uniref:Uncharacterized protein n=1 Tax=Reticulomyxa filosa TaxID=46433 RepID=X6P7V1_RETFI|nr:hypothetical protein RFI_03391 [Reticulomyxa filosa]|eukprot:ETO33712.1 hypothetical protein RFI_03391 [Reticulomyxa filosa]